MPGIIDRYILRETAESWLAVSAVLLLILIGNSFLLIFRQVSGGDIPHDAIAPFLVTRTVIFLVGIVPFSLYLGILIGMGRLYRDSEMAALGACGIGGWSIGLTRRPKRSKNANSGSFFTIVPANCRIH